jgi:hypothetical protein
MEDYNGSEIKVIIAEYTLDQGRYALGTTYFEGEFENKHNDGWFYTSANKQILS